GEDFSIATASQNAANAQMDLFGQQVLPSKKEALPSEDDEESIRVYKTIEQVPHEYFLVQSEKEIEGLVKKLSAQKSICFDTETTSTDANTAEIVGMSFSFKKGEAY